MADHWQDYVDDPRKPCKYGSSCFQTNKPHHETFKHPPHNLRKKTKPLPNPRRFTPYHREPHCPNRASTTKTVETVAAGTTSKSDDTATSISANRDTPKRKEVSIASKLPSDLKFHDKKSNKDTFKDLFLVDMPEDFFKFFEFLNESDNAFENNLNSVNLEPIGPFDLLLGELPILDEKDLYLINWRFFYDPPEFQSILKRKGKSEFHIGYFRDEPQDKPQFLGSNDSAKDCTISPIAENIFGAFYIYLKSEKEKSPFMSIICQKLMERVKVFAEENNYSLEPYNVKERLSKVNAKTLHGAGIVVPYDKKTKLGYRPLVENNANLKKLFKKLSEAESDKDKTHVLSELQPVITYASIAVDECDFGTGLEAGLDLFCSGLKDLESNAQSLLTSTYSLLNREAYGKIIEAHLKNRRKGPNMSLLTLR